GRQDTLPVGNQGERDPLQIVTRHASPPYIVLIRRTRRPTQQGRGAQIHESGGENPLGNHRKCFQREPRQSFRQQFARPRAAPPGPWLSTTIIHTGLHGPISVTSLRPSDETMERLMKAFAEARQVQDISCPSTSLTALAFGGASLRRDNPRHA